MELQRPHPRTRLSVSLYTLVAVWPFAVLSIAVAKLSAPKVGTLFPALWVIILLWLLAGYLPLRYRHSRFRIDNSRVTAVSGVFFRTTRQMPLVNVRQVTVIRGPLERRWGFAFVAISGAGGRVWLEGVAAAEAEALSRRLSHRGAP